MGVAWEWWRKPGNGGRELRNGGSVGIVEKAWEWGELSLGMGVAWEWWRKRENCGGRSIGIFGDRGNKSEIWEAVVVESSRMYCQW